MRAAAAPARTSGSRATMDSMTDTDAAKIIQPEDSVEDMKEREHVKPELPADVRVRFLSLIHI